MWLVCACNMSSTKGMEHVRSCSKCGPHPISARLQPEAVVTASYNYPFIDPVSF
jgi:hypothetical protein